VNLDCGAALTWCAGNRMTSTLKAARETPMKRK